VGVGLGAKLHSQLLAPEPKSESADKWIQINGLSETGISGWILRGFLERFSCHLLTQGGGALDQPVAACYTLGLLFCTLWLPLSAVYSNVNFRRRGSNGEEAQAEWIKQTDRVSATTLCGVITVWAGLGNDSERVLHGCTHAPYHHHYHHLQQQQQQQHSGDGTIKPVRAGRQTNRRSAMWRQGDLITDDVVE